MVKIVIVEKDFKDSKGKAYGGMNAYAAKKVGIKWKYSEDTIAMSKSSNKVATFTHEYIELTIFRHFPEMSYEDAHNLTISIEAAIVFVAEKGIQAALVA
jgi:hypothetical protein